MYRDIINVIKLNKYIISYFKFIIILIIKKRKLKIKWYSYKNNFYIIKYYFWQLGIEK